MKKTIVSTSLVILCLLSYSISFAALSQMTGKWENTDSGARGITTLVIDGNARNLTMHAWGKCHPNDCDWGEVAAYPYAPDVSAPLEMTAKAASAMFTTSFSQTLVIVRPAGNNTLRAEVFTRFTGYSNRNNYTAVYTFKRQLQLAPVRPMPLPMPIVKEDCVSFNPATATVTNINGNWTIVDGNHLMFNFGDKKAEALKALKIIKFYRMNSSCFVGRPDPSFQYLLVNGNAPQGNMPGEDCVSFNPNTIEVRNIGGSWKIVDGSHWLFNFGSKESEARKAFAIIKKYGFSRSCFVGRPNPSFKYLRK
ncbi:hypothetical protein EST62_02600 [Chlorobaculum sp. 24CR]|uniref:hypothetical protein n=1 Tax=Chlorobaculum sp. 24CR TaxID=2508878 RepID=UPI00100B505D|nr:hypothetical protein [Chlorobaculum sp. 24CR]RXK88548.1 hypothetical protein EST62_02600 [Chlorobaculum sp. 24CR]